MGIRLNVKKTYQHQSYGCYELYLRAQAQIKPAKLQALPQTTI